MQATTIGDREFSIVGLLDMEGVGMIPILDIPMMDEQPKEQREAVPV